MKDITCTLALTVLAGMSASSYGQSTVNIYGIIEQSGVQAFVNTPTKIRLTQLNPSTSGSSVFGFKGSEDLGGGYAAIFQLEGALAADTGGYGSASEPSGLNAPQSAIFNRHAWVGLQNNTLGSIKLGRSITPTILTLVNSNSIRPSYNTGLVTSITSQGLGNDFYNSNMIRYESFNIAGFSVQSLVSAGEVPVGGKGGKSYGVSGRYDGSIFTATAAHHVDRDQTDQHISWDVATGSLTFGPAHISAGYDRVKVPLTIQSAAGSTYRDSKMFTLGGFYQVQPLLTLSAQFYEVKYTTSQSSSQQRVLAAHYLFSKRTSVYLIASTVSSGPVGISVLNGVAAFPNVSAKGYGLGLTHIF